MTRIAHNRINLVGRRFGRLLVERDGQTQQGGALMWRCICDCGARHDVLGQHLRSGRVKSCGCLRAEQNRTAGLTHGYSRARWYGSWVQMWRRCTSPRAVGWANYGGRGITVCERWRDPAAFHADMGDHPAGLWDIDRIDNEKGYCLENCRWATRKQNINNRRVTLQVKYRGVTRSLQDWVELTGLPRRLVYERLFLLKWPPEEAFKPQLRQGTKAIARARGAP